MRSLSHLRRRYRRGKSSGWTSLAQAPPPPVGQGEGLSGSQARDVAGLQLQFADVFSPLPGRTPLITHNIETQPGLTVRTRPYRLPVHKQHVVRRELATMLELGVVEESHSDWCSPVVLVGNRTDPSGFPTSTTGLHQSL